MSALRLTGSFRLRLIRSQEMVSIRVNGNDSSQWGGNVSVCTLYSTNISAERSGILSGLESKCHHG